MQDVARNCKAGAVALYARAAVSLTKPAHFELRSWQLPGAASSAAVA